MLRSLRRLFERSARPHWVCLEPLLRQYLRAPQRFSDAQCAQTLTHIVALSAQVEDYLRHQETLVHNISVHLRGFGEHLKTQPEGPEKVQKVIAFAPISQQLINHLNRIEQNTKQLDQSLVQLRILQQIFDPTQTSLLRPEDNPVQNAFQMLLGCVVALSGSDTPLDVDPPTSDASCAIV